MKRILFFLTAFLFAATTWSYAQNTNPESLPDTVNRNDANGNKTGFWIEKDAGITYKGEYLAGKKIKSWAGYYPTSLVYKVEYYTNGLKDGICLQFDKRGKLTMVENYKNGMLDGVVLNYGNFSETPLAETEYRNGKRNGIYRLYYDNGKLQEQSNFKNDLKDGISVWNNKNGQKIAEYNYKSGNFEGIQKTFYENDTLQTVNTYIDNQLSGESQEFYRNGKTKMSGKYLNGKKEGPWTEFDELGKPVKVVKFKDGEEVKKK